MPGLGLLILIALGVGVVCYNRLSWARQTIDESWAKIDAEFKRRYQLIGDLVEVVRGYAAQEKVLLEHVTSLREKAMSRHDSLESQVDDESRLMLAVKQLFTAAENYPQLKADQRFLDLQKELADAEDRIASARDTFNTNVHNLNKMCQTLPDSIIASIFGFHPASFFDLSPEAERVVPRPAF